jgi:hypothetical protein
MGSLLGRSIWPEGPFKGHAPKATFTVIFILHQIQVKIQQQQQQKNTTKVDFQ